MIKKAALFAASVAAPLLWKRYLHKNGRWPHKAKCAVTFSFDYESISDIACMRRLCELLSSFDLPASHACVGRYVEQFKHDHQVLVDRGDEVMNHSYTHPNGVLNPYERFNELNEKRMEEEVMCCEKACEEVLGVRPVGFRTPHFGNLNCQRIYEILEKRGYRYSSSTNLTTTQSHGVPYYPNKKDFHKRGEPYYKVLELPVFSCPVHYYPVFDSWHCFELRRHDKHGMFHSAFLEALRLAEAHGSHLNVYFDPRHVAQSKDFERILESTKSRAWVATSKDIAEWWIRNS